MAVNISIYRIGNSIIGAYYEKQALATADLLNFQAFVADLFQ